MIESKQQHLKVFSYHEGFVKLEFSFDLERPNHKDEIRAFLEMLKSAQADVEAYLNKLK